jgi:hypothetical protein
VTTGWVLFVTNEDQNNLKVGQSINSVCMKLTHITCLAHALHTVTEDVR